MNNIQDFALFAKSRGVGDTYLSDYIMKGNQNYINPTIIEERTRNMTAMDVFSKLLSNNIIYIGDPIEDEMANVICSQLLWLDSQTDEDIMLYVNSPGGLVTAGLAIIDTLDFVHNDISTTCNGMAASMGAIILSSGKKGKRFSQPHSSILIHNISGGTYGNIADMRIAVAESERLSELLIDILAKNTGKTVEEVKRAIDRDKWLTPQEAIDFGLIDGIVKSKKK